MESTNNPRPGMNGLGNVSAVTGDTPPALRGHLSDGPIHGEHHHLHDHDLEHSHERARAPRTGRDMSHIQGWGADLDHKNRPAVPMESMPARLDHKPSAPPSQQPRHQEVFVSPERPSITPLFGTGPAPSLSFNASA